MSHAADAPTTDYEQIDSCVEYCSTNIDKHWNLDFNEIDGSNTVIAILDGAVNINHSAFTETLYDGKNFIPEVGDHYWYSNRESHGTMVAGIVAKFAPKAHLLFCCVVEEVSKYSRRAVLQAFDYLITRKEIGGALDIVVMSFGKHREDEEYKSRISKLSEMKVICIAAVGNGGLYQENIAYPACLCNVISVGGLNQFACRADFNPSEDADVYAPGKCVYAPAADHNKKFQKGNGTSCAAPAIAGIVACLFQCASKDSTELVEKIHDIDMIKKIFSAMSYTDMHGHQVFSPRTFFSNILNDTSCLRGIVAI